MHTHLVLAFLFSLDKIKSAAREMEGMLVAGFDLETTGLDTSKEKVIEVGVVLWDTERKAPLMCMNHLVNHPEMDKLDPRIVELTGITDLDLHMYGLRPEFVFPEVNRLFGFVDAIVAHNGNAFDKPMWEANCRAYSIAPPPEKLWVDTSCDVEYPIDCTTRKLKHLAAEHGFVNPFAHRALFDVLTMLKVTTNYDWTQITKYAKSPTLTVMAKVDFNKKELAKKLNYRWNGDKKQWTKSIKDFQLQAEEKDAKQLGFEIKILKGEK